MRNSKRNLLFAMLCVAARTSRAAALNHWRVGRGPCIRNHPLQASFGTSNGTSKNSSDASSPTQTLRQPTHQNSSSDTENTVSSNTQATKKKNWLWRWKRRASAMLSAAGFIDSSTRALVADPSHPYQAWKTTVQSLTKFLQATGIDLELSPKFNVRLLDNIVLLHRIETAALNGTDRRDLALSPTSSSFSACRNKNPLPEPAKALSFMKYATAAYGDNMIRAAELDVQGTLDGSFSGVSRNKISQHCGIPVSSIIRFDVQYNGNPKHLRHFVAVDHKHKAIVLAVRGTFTLSEVVADVAAFARPFCGGQAHSEMANMAEEVWKSAQSAVQKLLEDHPGYELVLTGHSLGAAAASLLCVWLYHHKALPPHISIRCFAFASPPAFAPLEAIPQAANACINYIHESDVVPFLSVDAIRHLFNCMQAIEDQKLSWRTRVRLATGYAAPSPELVEAFQEANQKRLPTKAGAPQLAIPARRSIWMREKDDGTFDQRVCDSQKLSKLGILLQTRMLDDHYPSRYEHALHNLEKEESEV